MKYASKLAMEIVKDAVLLSSTLAWNIHCSGQCSREQCRQAYFQSLASLNSCESNKDSTKKNYVSPNDNFNTSDSYSLGYENLESSRKSSGHANCYAASSTSPAGLCWTPELTDDCSPSKSPESFFHEDMSLVNSKYFINRKELPRCSIQITSDTDDGILDANYESDNKILDMLDTYSEDKSSDVLVTKSSSLVPLNKPGSKNSRNNKPKIVDRTNKLEQLARKTKEDKKFQPILKQANKKRSNKLQKRISSKRKVSHGRVNPFTSRRLGLHKNGGDDREMYANPIDDINHPPIVVPTPVVASKKSTLAECNESSAELIQNANSICYQPISVKHKLFSPKKDAVDTKECAFIKSEDFMYIGNNDLSYEKGLEASKLGNNKFKKNRPKSCVLPLSDNFHIENESSDGKTKSVTSPLISNSKLSRLKLVEDHRIVDKSDTISDPSTHRLSRKDKHDGRILCKLFRFPVLKSCRKKHHSCESSRQSPDSYDDSKHSSVKSSGIFCNFRSGFLSLFKQRGSSSSKHSKSSSNSRKRYPKDCTDNSPSHYETSTASTSNVDPVNNEKLIPVKADVLNHSDYSAFSAINNQPQSNIPNHRLLGEELVVHAPDNDTSASSRIQHESEQKVEESGVTSSARALPPLPASEKVATIASGESSSAIHTEEQKENESAIKPSSLMLKKGDPCPFASMLHKVKDVSHNKCYGFV